MSKIQNLKSKQFIPQNNHKNIKIHECNNGKITHNLTLNNIQYYESRHFGRDITKNINSKNNQTKIVKILVTKRNNNDINEKKISTSNQLAQQQPEKNMAEEERRQKENIINLNYYKRNNYLMPEYNRPKMSGSVLHSYIYFDLRNKNNNNNNDNNNNRQYTRNNIITNRLSTYKNNLTLYSSINNQNKPLLAKNTKINIKENVSSSNIVYNPRNTYIANSNKNFINQLQPMTHNSNIVKKDTKYRLKIINIQRKVNGVSNSPNNSIINILKNEKNINEKKIKNEPKKKPDFITNDEDLPFKYFDIRKVNNSQIPKEYINIIYYNLLKEEQKGISPMPDYTCLSRQPEINDKIRGILVDWLIDVHYKLHFTDETLFITISIIDRFLSVSEIKRVKFQLLGITALMIACKHEEIDLLKINDFIYLTDNAYKKNEVIKMEEELLDKLNFSFVYPSPIKLFEYLSLHFGFNKTQHLMGKFLMENFLLDIKNVKYSPSIISCACIYIVMKFCKLRNYKDSYNDKFFNIDPNNKQYSEHDVKECAKDICHLVDHINKNNFLSCYKKYSKPEQENVSLMLVNK